MDGDIAQDPAQSPLTVGEKLRVAREAQGLELAELASRTRIPQRHLEAIEQSNFTGLPSITYALGFAKAYARAVGADEVAIARELRIELGDNPERAAPTPSYEMSDPARVPPAWLAWVGGLVGLVALVGAVLWYGTDWFRGSAPPPETLSTDAGSLGGPANQTAPAEATTPAAGGQVTLVALDTVWIRVTDGAGTRLAEKEMLAGERYDVPATADRPRVRTGAPDKIQVLLNGSIVPPLGTGRETVEVEVTAAALQARGTPGASPTPAGSASGVTTTPPGASGQAPAGNSSTLPE